MGNGRPGQMGTLTIPDNVDKLYWLMNTTGQIADFFASMDVDGDAVDPNGWFQDQLNDMEHRLFTAGYRPSRG